MTMDRTKSVLRTKRAPRCFMLACATRLTGRSVYSCAAVLRRGLERE